MKDHPRISKVPAGLKICLIACILVAVFFSLNRNIVFQQLADEGFLWYGAVQTAAGQVPIRDFRSYDPGRYYWAALWFKLLRDDGIVTLRLACALFQLIGLIFGLLVARRLSRSWPFLWIMGILLTLWTFPQYKSFEKTIILIAVYLAVLLMEAASPPRYFISGVFIGLAAFFGRNHGLYLFIAFSGLIIFIQLKQGGNRIVRRTAAWASGILLGYSPMLLMFIFVPGFFKSVMESIALLLYMMREFGNPNAVRSVEWPWVIKYSNMILFRAVRAFYMSSLYLLIPAFYCGTGIYILFSKSRLSGRKLILAASFFIGVVYLHHLFSLPLIIHISDIMPVFIIGTVAFSLAIKSPYRKLLTVFVLLFFFLGICSNSKKMIINPFIHKILSGDQVVLKEIRGERLWIEKKEGALIDDIVRINSRLVGPDENLLFLNRWPVFYVILRRVSPVINTMLVVRQPSFYQEAFIRQLEEGNVNWVITGESWTMNIRREVPFFHAEIPLIWKYMTAEFKRVEAWKQFPGWHLYRRR